MPVTVLTYDAVPMGTGWTGAAPFIVNDTDPLTGTTQALSCGDLGDTSKVEVFPPGFTLTNAGQVFVRYNAETENSVDYGRIYIDGTNRVSPNGFTRWSTLAVTGLAAGAHTFSFEYNKNGSVSSGFDNLHIGSIYVVDGDISNLTVDKLETRHNGSDAIVYWSSALDGQSGYSYEWSMDGGVTVYSTTEKHLTLTGLSSSTTHTFNVRPVYTGYGSGQWTDVVIDFTTDTQQLGSFIDDFWYRDPSTYVNSGEPAETVIHSGSSRVGAVASRLTYPIGASSFILDAYVSGGADRMDIGVVDPTVDITSIGAAGFGAGLPSLSGTQGFTGFALDVFQNVIRSYINGVAGPISSVNPADNAYSAYRIKYKVVGANLTITLFKNGSTILFYTAAAPSWSMGRPVVASGSGSISGLFKVKGTPSWTIPDLTSSSVQGLTAYGMNNAILFSWKNHDDASSYDYSFDGGTTFTNTASNSVKVSGLANGDSRTLVVRGVSTLGGMTPWTSSVTATAAPATTYTGQILEKNPIFHLTLDELEDNFNDISETRAVYTAIAPNRGLAPIARDSTASVATNGDAIARAPITPAMETTTWTIEMWVNIPPSSVNILGTILKIGDANGFGIGVGNGTHTNAGRQLIGITEGSTWMATPVYFTNPQSRTYHLVVTRDGNSYTYFVNGVQVHTQTSTSTTPTGYVTVGSATGTRVMSPDILIDSVSMYPSVLTGTQITNHYKYGVLLTESVLETVPLNGGIAARWDVVQGADSYDYSIDGGSTWTNVPAPAESISVDMSSSVTLTGLPNDVPVDVVVRPKNSVQTGQWSSSSSATPNSDRYVVHWDNFNRPASTTTPGLPQVGGPYTAMAGTTWGITSGGRLYTPTSVSSAKLTFPGTANFDATFELPNAPNGTTGFIYRYTDANNFMMAYRVGQSDSNGRWAMWTINAGSDRDMISTNTGVARTTDVVRIIGLNQFIYMFINGNLLGIREDLRWATPGTTLGFWSSGSVNGHLDNVVVWNKPDFDPKTVTTSSTAHVYKGRDNYNDDLGSTP